MSAIGKIIDGNALAARIHERIAKEVTELRATGHPPCLAAVLIGDDEGDRGGSLSAATSYALSQAKHAKAVGVEYRLVRLPADASAASVSDVVTRLNNDSSVSGIMLHLPVPRHLDAFALQQKIAPGKDVEGVNAANLGLLAMGRGALVPCTAAAAFACLQATAVDIRGKHAVVVGRSAIAGKPVAMLLLADHATVTQCHTQTRDLAAHTRTADILVVAAGKAGLIGADHVSPGAIVIDVGTNRQSKRQPDGTEKVQTVGDVRFDEVAGIASFITPVPGGVGPVTVAMLLSNVVAAARSV